jgi:thioredoxin:protein disulfide reductase
MTRLLPLLLALLLTPAAYAAQSAGGDILPPEQAFPASAQALNADTVAVHWNVTPGYYLYADKFAFASDTSGITLGKPKIPPGKVKDDQFLGRVEIFTHGLTVRLPVTGSAREVTLKVTAQGCKENAICYPPFTQTLQVTLPPQKTAASSSESPLAALTGDTADNQFLPPDQAFKLDLQTAGPNRLVAHWDIAHGYHLYRDQIKFSLENASGLSLGKIQMPKGEVVDDAFLGRQVVYAEPIDVTVPVTRTAGSSGSGTLVVRYQGCADKGICYPPITKRIAFTLPAVGSAADATTPPAAASTSTATSPNTAQDNIASGSEQDRLARFLLDKPLWMSLGLFFLIGLGLAFTPCVFPMIPILSGIIVGQKETPSTGRAFVLSLVYVLAMALTYTVAGVIVGLTGAGVQAWFQNPWVLSAFAVIFVLLSLSMFGFYELQMPNFVQSRLTEISNRQQGGTLFGVAIMGFLSALIVGPCVTAPLVAALLVIANTGDAVLGGLSLFSLSLGMGAPLLLIGTAGGKLLPRAGAWMDAIKAVFGVLLLAVAIWMLSRFLPAWATAALSALLLIASGIYLGALESTGDSGWRKLWKSTGFVLLLWGSLVLIGVAAGGGGLLTPLKGLFGGAGGSGPATAVHALPFKRIKGVQGLEQALAAANGRPVMLDFYADWCVSCKEMEEYTFSDPAVQKALSNFVLLQADVTANDAADQALLKRFGLFGPPGIIFFGGNGREERNLRVVGYMPAGDFLKKIEQLR